MGIDFIRKAAPSFRKGLDRRRIELATPNLFTQEPTSAPRAYAAQLRSDKMLAVGEKLGVRLDGQNVLALRGLDLVAVFKSPGADLKNALSASFGEACGTVQAVHSVARIAEITVC
ncbi:MAG TPA: hypothetical protein VMT39_03330 [Candidatus Bathyarchaeia archaeon]|nr:hypothetical protein [Candidatus Bathyarchaeia archaeon]